ncbi:hypothetical protein HK405_015113 [Cladochytrium tenue]|nr:hypothetical protein HK405_015113 [Cladochytrium tenue]
MSATVFVSRRVDPWLFAAVGATAFALAARDRFSSTTTPAAPEADPYIVAAPPPTTAAAPTGGIARDNHQHDDAALAPKDRVDRSLPRLLARKARRWWAASDGDSLGAVRIVPPAGAASELPGSA